MTASYPFDQTYAVLGKSLNISAKRHGLITGNIANIDTVGYQPKDLDFQETLRKAIDSTPGKLSRTHPGHLPSRGELDSVSGKPRLRTGNPNNPDSVDIDTEMTNLMENNLKYRTSVEMLLRKLGILRHAITEGGR